MHSPPAIVFVLYVIIILGMIIGEYALYKDEIESFISKVKVKRVKSEAQRFYSGTAWAKAKRRVRALQMEISGLDFVYCEDCGVTGKDLDYALKPVVMSIGHDKARSTHPHLALNLDNLFNQCMPCNLAQGTDSRQITGYNTVNLNS